MIFQGWLLQMEKLPEELHWNLRPVYTAWVRSWSVASGSEWLYAMWWGWLNWETHEIGLKKIPPGYFGLFIVPNEIK